MSAVFPSIRSCGGWKIPASISHVSLCAKEYYPLLHCLYDVFVHIDADQDPCLVDTVKEGTKREIAGGAKKSCYGVKVFDLRVVLQHSFEFLDQGVAVAVGEKIGLDHVRGAA